MIRPTLRAKHHNARTCSRRSKSVGPEHAARTPSTVLTLIAADSPDAFLDSLVGQEDAGLLGSAAQLSVSEGSRR